MRIAGKITASLMMIMMLIASTGCGALIVGGAAAAGTYVYVDGNARADYRTSIHNGYNATLEACRELGMNITSQSIDGNDASVKADYQGDNIYIDLSLEGDNLTQITVRVGLLGNKTKSRRIHDAIARNL